MNGCRFQSVAVFLYQAFCPNMALKCHCWVETSRLQNKNKKKNSHPLIYTLEKGCTCLRSTNFVGESYLRGVIFISNSSLTIHHHLPSNQKFPQCVSPFCLPSKHLISKVRVDAGEILSVSWLHWRPFQVEGPRGFTFGVPKFIPTPTASEMNVSVFFSKRVELSHLQTRVAVTPVFEVKIWEQKTSCFLNRTTTVSLIFFGPKTPKQKKTGGSVVQEPWYSPAPGRFFFKRGRVGLWDLYKWP